MAYLSCPIAYILISIVLKSVCRSTVSTHAISLAETVIYWSLKLKMSRSVHQDLSFLLIFDMREVVFMGVYTSLYESRTMF
jgi:hypothetical protein